ncbi:MAG TPA: Hpt domain-containing protein [Polyangiaceae bacterium]|jgi:HPt (histidine-containing phosphotransfer) domain-containing protein
MTGEADPAIQSLLAAAKEQFAAGLGARLDAIEALVAAGTWEEVRRGVHRLRGAAATYGFAALGERAATIEEALFDADDAPGPDVRQAIVEGVQALRMEATRAAGGGL